MHGVIMKVGALQDMGAFPLLRHLHFFGALDCTMGVNLGVFGCFLAFLPIFGRPT
jgi:hypothetical protein